MSDPLSPAVDAADLRHVRSLLAVARRSSFSAAARDLHLTQQAVSAHVQRLERSLGVRLVDRTTRSVRLTVDGRRFAADAARAVAALDELWERTRRRGSGQTGTVRLGLSNAAGHDLAPELVEATGRRHPGIAIAVSEGAAGEGLGRLEAGAVDLALLLAPGRGADAGRFDGWTVSAGTVAALVARTGPLGRLHRVGPKDLRPLALVVPKAALSPGLHEAATAFAQQAAVPTTVAAMTGNAVPGAVYDGRAFALWPTVIPRRYVPSGLVALPVEGPTPPVDLRLLFRSRSLGPAAARVLEVARELWPPPDGEAARPGRAR
jgi:DNA-binding transcriptional LysR family regulator